MCVCVCSDDKEYDVYISYARNSEEEQFVLTTLRSVLENELGYSVCIFDRDSLPGGSEYSQYPLQYYTLSHRGRAAARTHTAVRTHAVVHSHTLGHTQCSTHSYGSTHSV